MIRTDYFEYLCLLVGKNQSEPYSLLLERLFSIGFYSMVPNDDNRGVDGEQLRDQYIDAMGSSARPLSFPKFSCSVFEMMIGLAKRMEFELGGGKYEKKASYWFWVLIDNLRLGWCKNDIYSMSEVDFVIDRMLSREYNRNGEGGLFPLNHSKKDQRKVEIWYQMSEWIIQNYPI